MVTHDQYLSVKQRKPRSPPPDEKNQNLTRRFPKDNPNLLVLVADKGNTTMFMEKQFHRQKALTLLEDVITYRKITEDPTKTLEWKSNNFVKKLLDEYSS